MNLFQKLQRWVFISFPPNKKRKPKERELSLLLKSFSNQVGWYNPYTDTIDEPFFREIKHLQKQLHVIYIDLRLEGAKVISDSKGNREERELEWLTQLLLQLIFQSSHVSQDSFSFAFIRKDLSNTDQINLQHARERFFHLIKICNLERVHPWEDTLLFLWVVFSLENLDWKNCIYSEKPVDGSILQHHLEDMYFLTCQLEDHKQWLLPQAIQSLKSQFLITFEVISKLNQWIPNLLKCLKNDITYTPRTIHLTGDVFRNRANDLKQSFESDLVTYREEQDQKRIASLVEKLYPSSSIQEFPQYNSETQEVFRSANFQGLIHIPIAAILYTFATTLSKERIKPLLQGLALHGTFVSETGRKQFIDITDRFEAITQELFDVVEEFSSPSQSVLLNAKNILKTPILDEPQKKIVRKAQQESNKKIYQLAQDSLNGFKLLTTMFEICDQDLSSPTPQIFDSLKAISRHHPEILEGLKPSNDSLKTMIEILCIFVSEAHHKSTNN
jgi:hypothetical protein